MGRRGDGNFCVVRSHLTYQGIYVVEIETHGFDYVSPGMLVEKYAGEGQCFDDPRDAVKTAIAIRDAWRADGGEVEGITYGTTAGGMFEPEVFDGTDDELLAKAQEDFDAIPKCDKCGEVRTETYLIDGDKDLGEFCSDRCASVVEREYYVSHHIDDWRVTAVANIAKQGKGYLFGMLQRRNDRKLDRAKVMRRFTTARLARVVVNKLTDSEVQAWAED